jgi:predicted RNase H-like HicB family nuclease
MLETDNQGGARMAEYRYTVIYEPAEEGGYLVTIPALGGLATQGKTLEQAREMAKDAIRCHLQGLQKDGEEIPVEHGPVRIESVTVSV